MAIGKHKEVLISKIIILLSMGSIGLSQVPMTDFFPYSSYQGASEISFSDDSSHRVELEAPFHFLNHSHWVAFIGSNGVISFRNTFTGNSPNCAQPGSLPMIMVYLADGVPASGSTLTYFQSTGVTWLRKAKEILLAGFPLLENVNPSWVFAVTWKDVAAHNMNSRLRNTFQSILIVDSSSSQSYVIFLFNKIEWVRENFASVGFDGGDSQTIYTVPGSCTSAVSSVLQESNVKSPGKWIFKVDKSIVTELSCGDATSSGGLDFRDKIVSVMGNLPLIVKLCLAPNSTVTCEFKDPSRIAPIQSKGILLPSLNEVICPVPFLYSLGRMTVDVVVSSGSKPRILHQGHIFVVTEVDYGRQPTILLNKTLENSYLLTAHWDPSSMSMEGFKRFEVDDCSHKNNFTFVEVTLLEYDGYKWKELGSITKPAFNTGVYVTTFNITRFQELTEGSNKILIRSFGLKAKHTFSSSGQEVVKILPANIASGMNILLSQIRNASQNFTDNDKPNAFDKTCQSWYSHETASNAHDTSPCALSVEQAQFDWRFKLDDSAFSTLLRNSNVSSIYIQKNPSTSGGATQCLYDTEGRLIIEAGKRVLRSSPSSWKNYWIHYWNEALPYLFCSKLGNLVPENKFLYIGKRLINDGTEYKFPKVARAVGQGHITTFDGLNYEIGVRGEYVMITQRTTEEFTHLNFQSFKMHLVFGSARFENSIEPVIEMVTMQQSFEGHDISVQVYCSSQNSKLSVMVNNDLLDTDFSISELNIYYHGLAVLFKSEWEIILTFATGYSFNIKVDGLTGSLFVISTMDPKRNGKISGLWGNSDGDMNNDFMDPDGSSAIYVDENPSISEIHENFASLWLVDYKNSLIPKSIIANWQMSISYNIPSTWFYNYNYTTEALVNQTEHEFCIGDVDCEFDFEMTSSILYAEFTKTANTIFGGMKEAASLKIYRCPWISEQPNVDVIVDNYYQDSTLQLRCSDDKDISPGVKVISFTCKSKGDRARWVNPDFGELISTKGFSCSTPKTEPGVPDIVPHDEDVEDTTFSPTEVVPIKAIAAEHPKSDHSRSEVFIFMFVIIIIFALVAVAVMKYPTCRPVKARILGLRTRSESVYNFSETASVDE